MPDLRKLENPTVAERYRVEISNRFEGIEEIDLQWGEMVDMIKEVGLETLGPKQKNRQNEWFDDECRNVSDVRKILRKEWLNDTQDGRKKEQLRNATKLAKTIYRRKKKQTLEKVLREIEEDRGQGRVRDQFQKIKAVRNGYQPRTDIHS